MSIVRVIPLYKKIASEILKLIRSGHYPTGTLPSEEQLSASMGVSKHTVREALAELTSLSYILKRHGIGNIILDSVLDTQFRIDANMNFMQLLHRAGYETKLEQMNFHIQSMAMYGFEKQSYYIYDEIMYANSHPATQHRIFIPTDLFARNHPLQDCPGIGLFDLFSNQQMVAHHSIVEIVPELADEHIKELFHLPESAIINTWEEIIYDSNDDPICNAKLKFNPNFFPLRMVRKDFEIID